MIINGLGEHDPWPPREQRRDGRDLDFIRLSEPRTYLLFERLLAQYQSQCRVG